MGTNVGILEELLEGERRSLMEGSDTSVTIACLSLFEIPYGFELATKKGDNLQLSSISLAILLCISAVVFILDRSLKIDRIGRVQIREEGKGKF